MQFHGINRGSERGNRNIRDYGKALASVRPLAHMAGKKLSARQRRILKMLRTRKRRRFDGEEKPSF